MSNIRQFIKGQTIMAKPRAQTIQQRFGFMDDDLKKPKHDELMKWLDDCVEEKLQGWLGIPKDWSESEIAELKKTASAQRMSKIQQLQKELDKEKSSPEYDLYTSYGNFTSEEKERMNEKYKLEKAGRISKLESKFSKHQGQSKALFHRQNRRFVLLQNSGKNQ
jgi:hypothetical protein